MDDIEALLAELTDKERAFAVAYAACLNGAKAARAAHYSEASIYAIASENLRKPKIRAVIDALLGESVMPASETLARLTDHARGSMEDFLTVRGRGVTLDLKKATERGVLHLVKRYSKTKQGVSIELHDPQAALQLLGRHHKLFVDRTELTGKDGARARYGRRLRTSTTRPPRRCCTTGRCGRAMSSCRRPGPGSAGSSWPAAAGARLAPAPSISAGGSSSAARGGSA
jgi:phage terminase small subunit